MLSVEGTRFWLCFSRGKHKDSGKNERAPHETKPNGSLAVIVCLSARLYVRLHMDGGQKSS